jgi:drug/metabolite transporter (DMT)-like permease
VGLVGGIFGNCFMSVALVYYSPVVVNNMLLLEPFGSQLTAYIYNIDQLPGIITVVGSIVTVIGIYLIAKHTINKNKPLWLILNFNSLN